MEAVRWYLSISVVLENGEMANKVIISDVTADLGQPEAFREQTFGHTVGRMMYILATHRWAQRVLGMGLLWRAYSADTESFYHTSPAAVSARKWGEVGDMFISLAIHSVPELVTSRGGGGCGLKRV